MKIKILIFKVSSLVSRNRHLSLLDMLYTSNTDISVLHEAKIPSDREEELFKVLKRTIKCTTSASETEVVVQLL